MVGSGSSAISRGHQHLPLAKPINTVSGYPPCCQGACNSGHGFPCQVLELSAVGTRQSFFHLIVIRPIRTIMKDSSVAVEAPDNPRSNKILRCRMCSPGHHTQHLLLGTAGQVVPLSPASRRLFLHALAAWRRTTVVRATDTSRRCARVRAYICLDRLGNRDQGHSPLQPRPKHLLACNEGSVRSIACRNECADSSVAKRPFVRARVGPVARSPCCLVFLWLDDVDGHLQCEETRIKPRPAGTEGHQHTSTPLDSVSQSSIRSISTDNM